MRLILLMISLASALAASGSAAVNAQSIAKSASGVPSAPIGHLQPRAQQFSPQSAANQAEQQQMSAFDARQQRLDVELDKRLNICRC
jgi:hypothetical protein